jgi:hypothetical protein
MPATLGMDVDAVVVAAMHCGLCVGGLDGTQDGEGMWFLVRHNRSCGRRRTIV